MRLRRKPWARPELAASDFFIDNPIYLKNKWQAEFANNNPMQLELGCGKGVFIAQVAVDHPNVNYIAIDIKSEVLALAKRKAEELYAAKNLSPKMNLRLMSHDIERLQDIMGELDKVERIYINFCNPWPKPRHAKHRLTHTRQLMLYKNYMLPNAEIWFKTDDDMLFSESLNYFQEAGYLIKYQTLDLHNSNFSFNYMTEHEKMFSEKGIKIKFLIASAIEG